MTACEDCGHVGNLVQIIDERHDETYLVCRDKPACGARRVLKAQDAHLEAAHEERTEHPEADS